MKLNYVTLNDRLNYRVSGFGTGGPLKGIARVLKAKRQET